MVHAVQELDTDYTAKARQTTAQGSGAVAPPGFTSNWLPQSGEGIVMICPKCKSGQLAATADVIAEHYEYAVLRCSQAKCLHQVAIQIIDLKDTDSGLYAEMVATGLIDSRYTVLCPRRAA
ncbi:MAG: hypothetical protein L0312_18395 [Acidobacteria bacterium]|nr:hypothetical protein [Acidobacteriota bacterium]